MAGAAKMEERIPPDQKLWEYLSRVVGFDAELEEEYRATLEKRWIPLGEVLLREGIIRVSQMMTLLDMQVDEPHLRIGDLAVREGFCTHESIQRALGIQREQSPHPVELLLQDSRMDQASLFDGVLSYVRHLEGLVHSLRNRSQANEPSVSAKRS